MLKYIDAHIHLDKYSQEERSLLLLRAKAADVTHLVAVSMDLKSSLITHRLASEIKSSELPVIVPAYGFHPEQPILSKAEEEKLISWIKQRSAAGELFAIGEVGLPYYSRLEAKEKGEHLEEQGYIDLLERFIILAKELNRPIVLHAVYEDAGIACDLLAKHQMKKAHFHWFKGDRVTIERMIAAGYYISITPDVYTEQEIQQLVLTYPIELMMVETDGPWPFEGQFQGRFTESAMVVDVAARIAELKQMPLNQVVDQLYRNSIHFYMS